MSRFHRDTFHPVKPDRAPVRGETVRKTHGKRSGHTPPPWVGDPGATQPAEPLDLRNAPPADRSSASRRARKARRRRA